ncbi:RagB/SusD family nutrient uptake outer membrane protein [Mangrovibacterium lignilyticum]|uniref:RagB/SusD family nutrient uptake outer membrane protein n=1 Tax=Mangrovibacterium lignilyticum TaxID=2668052 RepID=UPI0013D1E619|nr:RagB/SusD family nutrient uptake outer membrane protein [Mangrovibacterium lignilyticum]
MKNTIYIICGLLLLVATACEKDFLDVKSPSSVDEDFVFSSSDEAFKVLGGCYDIWHHADHFMFYDVQIVGSDAECHPETYSAQQRHVPEGLYAEELPINYKRSVAAWADFYTIINRTNIMMKAISGKDDYLAAVEAGTPNDWTQLYGEAAAFRANMYLYLTRYFGDVPYFDVPVYNTSQTDSAGLVSRDIIYDKEIAHLKMVEPLMYRIGESGINAERFSRTFVQALIGKIALWAGGWSLRRTDFDYAPVALEQKGSEKWNAIYARRTDYKDYYQIAKEYLEKCINNSGSAYLITSDPRGDGFNNPFQYHFQNLLDLKVSPESIYEMGATRAVDNSEFPYAFGRPSGGGGSNAFPCKSYGQSRMHASFYYGDYSPKDLRRDVTVGVTANSGSCSEWMIDFTPGNRQKGGLCNNKTDESRMSDPYTIKQRSSGVNWVQMRLAQVVLMLAETYVELGEEAKAKTELTKIRSRAFSSEDQTEMVTNYINSLSGDDLKNAIVEEHKLELAGEGHHRFEMIRSGLMPEKIKRLKDNQKAMVEGLKNQGFYTFANGNTISNYIWVKTVNTADYGMSKMLTTECEVDENDPTYPIKHPGWRGNCDLWGSYGFFNDEGDRNLAIKGLFRYIDPDGSEAVTLEADGYVKTDWGSTIVVNEAQYTTDVFKGYTDEYYEAGVPPRYLYPLSSETISKSNGLITNGYGFAQE